MTTITAPETDPAGADAEPRIDWKSVAYMLRGVGPWAVLAFAILLVVALSISPTQRPYALFYGPTFFLIAVSMFAWRYQDAREKVTGRRYSTTVVPGVLATVTLFASLVGIILAMNYATARAAAPAKFAETIGYAPGHSWDVAAAGYWACGELSRGADPAALVDELMAEGDARGNLYTTLDAARVVDNAHLICPNVTG